MAKAYWIACYHAIKNPDALAAYAKLAAPAIQAAGGRFLARGMPAKTYEAGLSQRVVVIEFDSVAQATAAHDSADASGLVTVVCLGLITSSRPQLVWARPLGSRSTRAPPHLFS